jgi:hypothetical protein
VAPVSANQTDATEEVDESEVGEEAEPLSRTGHASHREPTLQAQERKGDGRTGWPDRTFAIEGIAGA